MERYNGRDSKGSRNLKDHPKKMNNPDSIILKKSENLPWGFPGGSVVKTLCSHCRGHWFDPWLRLRKVKSHKPHGASKKTNKKKTNKQKKKQKE